MTRKEIMQKMCSVHSKDSMAGTKNKEKQIFGPSFHKYDSQKAHHLRIAKYKPIKNDKEKQNPRSLPQSAETSLVHKQKSKVNDSRTSETPKQQVTTLFSSLWT